MTYSSAMSMSRQRFGTRNQNITGFRSNKKSIGPVSNTIILVVLACLLGLLYLTQVTKTNAYGYKISNLQKQQADLQQQHDELEVASARLQSLDRVKNSQPAKSLVSVAPSGTVAN